MLESADGIRVVNSVASSAFDAIDVTYECHFFHCDILANFLDWLICFVFFHDLACRRLLGVFWKAVRFFDSVHFNEIIFLAKKILIPICSIFL